MSEPIQNILKEFREHLPCPECAKLLDRIEAACMSLARAREILEEAGMDFHPDGRFITTMIDGWFAWEPGADSIGLDGGFTADQLEALAVWMRAHGEKA